MGDRLIRVFPRTRLRAGIGADDLPIHIRAQVFAYHRPARGSLDFGAAFGGDGAGVVRPLGNEHGRNFERPAKGGSPSALLIDIGSQVHADDNSTVLHKSNSSVRLPIISRAL